MCTCVCVCVCLVRILYRFVDIREQIVGYSWGLGVMITDPNAHNERRILANLPSTTTSYTHNIHQRSTYTQHIMYVRYNIPLCILSTGLCGCGLTLPPSIPRERGLYIVISKYCHMILFRTPKTQTLSHVLSDTNMLSYARRGRTARCVSCGRRTM